MLSIESFATQLTHILPAGSRVRSHLLLPPTANDEREFPAHFPLWLSAVLRSQGMTQLRDHQWQALQLLHQGRDVCLTIPTGSGRGIVRLLAMYQSLGVSQPGHGLFIFPQKNRGLAQLGTAMSWNDHLAPEHRLSVAIYDGDTPGTQRRLIRQSVPHLLLTTPEMLHAGILAYHSGWRTLFQDLRYIVLADLHLCVGALMTHLGHLLRRAYRLAGHYGSQPHFLLTSPPLGNPEEVAYTLTGRSCTAVYQDSWRRQPQRRVLIETHQDPTTVVRELLERHRDAQVPALVLSPNPDDLRQHDTSITTFRLPPTSEAYQNAELRLLRGEDAAIVMPHDEPTVFVRPNAVRSIIFLGLPASLMHLHAYLSLLANGHTSSISILVLQGKTPLERYVLSHPVVYQNHWPQRLPLAFSNPSIIQQHVLCAAAELALKAGEHYEGVYNLDDFLRQLVSDQAVIRRTTSRQWVTTQHRPHRRVLLRWYEHPATLIDRLNTQRLTRLTSAQAFRTCFEGAQYVHDDGRMFHVEHEADERRRIVVRPSHAGYLTRGLLRTKVHDKRLAAAAIKVPYRLTYGWLDYAESLQAYERLEPQTHARQSVHMLPERTRQIRTQGVWLDFPGRSMSSQAQAPLHALVHAVLAGLPLLFRHGIEDIRGGVYTPEIEGERGLEAVFVDAHAGGNGISADIYQAHEHVFRAALHLLLQCDCTDGCSRCISGHRCDTCKAGEVLDRQAGIRLLQQMLGEAVPQFETVMLHPRQDHTPRRLYLCVTTQKSAEEVGGWQHKHLLGLGLAMTYDTQDKSYHVYTEETVNLLVASLRQADLIIGFNTRDFDYQVLQPYTDMPLPMLPTYAMLDEVQKALGYRVNFRHLVSETLDIERPDDSGLTLQWYQEGNTERLIQLCRRDTDLMRDLVRHICTTGTLDYRDRSGTRRTVSVNSQLIGNAYG